MMHKRKGNNDSKSIRCHKRISQREVHRNNDLSQNENINYQNVYNSVKAVFRGKIIVLNAYIRKEERSKTSYLCDQLRKLERERKIKLKIICFFFNRSQINESEI